MARTTTKRTLKNTGRKPQSPLGWDPAKVKSRGRRKGGMRGWDPTKVKS